VGSLRTRARAPILTVNDICGGSVLLPCWRDDDYDQLLDKKLKKIKEYTW
jgi:hypothetical protein